MSSGQQWERDQDDATLDRLLGGLGSASVEEEGGFAQRVVRGVEARLAVAQGRRGVASGGAGWGWGIGFASAALALAVGAAVMGLGGRGGPGGLKVVERARDQARGVAAEATRRIGRPVQVAAGERAERAHQPGLRKSARDEAGFRGSGGARDRLDGLGQARAPEWREASFPAPPAPLTEEEKLLLKVVHRGDPVELAMLDPQVREDSLVKERKEVDQFFYKPRRIDDKGNLIDASGKVLIEVATGDQR